MTQRLAIDGGEPVRREPFPHWPVAGAREAELLRQVLESGVWAGSGPMEQEFARRFGEFCGVSHVICVANGSVALEIALRAVGVGPGDEVIVPALTWIGTAWSVVQVGAVPVFADVGRHDWCLDPDAVAEMVTSRTRAVVPVHLYDQVADMDALLGIAREASLFVIEDCAHAHGGRLAGRGVGTLGHLGTFSFQQSKAMTAGEGGAVIANDASLARRVHAIKDCGRPFRKRGAAGFGGNYRLTEFQAAILLAQLERLEDHLERKASNIAFLGERLLDIPGIAPLHTRDSTTRRGLYALALRFDPDAFADLPRTFLLRALRAEGIPAQPPYSVVYRSPLWTSGRRFIKWEAEANPDQRLGLGARCPTAELVAETEGLVLFHEVFLGTKSDMADVAAAFEKIQRSPPKPGLRTLGRRVRDKARQAVDRSRRQP
jgi:L-glutamine:2-deoxy-scyllo-inosose/3-amino-2,3-dideoxy-scyllo-inosose aminotransferase